MTAKELPRYIPSHELLKNAEPNDIFKQARRNGEVSRLKEEYSREYLLEHGLCTPEEYETIPASTERRDTMRRAQAWGEIANKVFGAEF